MLIEDPPVPYAKISAKLRIPVENIAPNRGRCLAKLRHDPAIAALINAEAGAARRHTRAGNGAVMTVSKWLRPAMPTAKPGVPDSK